jgi:hypothetical protein
VTAVVASIKSHLSVKIAGERRNSSTREITPLPWKLISNARHFARGLVTQVKIKSTK